ncbi:MAG: hypothetical protein HY286_03905 [Planctomycetes bacterium]|nr:hypothetical protein [Planctomycetota bacterium]
MQFRNLCLVSIACIIAAAGTARAQGFTPNHIFIGYNSTPGEIHELDLAGNDVRAIAAQGFGFATDLAFGGNGHLFATFSTGNAVVEIDSAGALVQQFDGGGKLDTPVSLLAGADGHWLVANYNTGKLVELDPAGAFVRESQPGAAFGFYGGAIAANGRYWYTTGQQGKILCVDPSGAISKQITPNLTNPYAQRLTIAADGHVFVDIYASPQSEQIEEYDENGVFVGVLTAISSAFDMCFGPDGNLYVVVAGGQLKVYSRLGSFIKTIALPPPLQSGSPVSIAFSPVRFSAKVTGTVARAGAPSVSIKENVVVSYFAGAGASSIQFTDDPNNALDFASLFQTVTLQFHGYEIEKNAADKIRATQQTQVNWPSPPGGTSSLSMLWNGTVDVNSNFIAKKGRGSLQRACGAGSLDALVTTIKVVP